ncbi:hypothetical protein BDV98DRAFT_576028 [Pterulicium gracile]|uniref:F-box domain-containing protein n=1 Tax=Pterulicium gracile TaxID=1884261 RepID=A0A5C3Q5T5_9AGAR|nr:hypothetical protein BDV98DRAFT_576028 [Pterula gracilis]
MNHNFPREELTRSRILITEGTPKIPELCAAIERLQYLYSSLCSAVTKHSSFLAPINHLPNDILLIIFDFLHKDIYSGRYAMWSVSAVCKRWRGLSVSRAQLWTELTHPAYFGLEPTCMHHRVHLQLERIVGSNTC